MEIRVSNPLLVPDLVDFLRNSQCVVERTGDCELRVQVPSAASEAQARLELRLYVLAWRALNPGGGAYVVS